MMVMTVVMLLFGVVLLCVVWLLLRAVVLVSLVFRGLCMCVGVGGVVVECVTTQNITTTKKK